MGHGSTFRGRWSMLFRELPLHVMRAGLHQPESASTTVIPETLSSETLM